MSENYEVTVYMILFIGNAVMIITGQPIDQSVKTEVLDLGNVQSSCTMVTDFPIKNSAVTGGIIRNKPIICGGWNGNAFDDCFIYQNNEFTPLINKMDKKRNAASSITINNKLWVTGGTENNVKHNSTLYIDINEEGTEAIIEPGPDLPIAMGNHAIVSINQSCAMIIGGKTTTTETSKETWYYNWESKYWIKGPELVTGRAKHVAGCVIDDITNEMHIIVTAGWYEPWNAMDSTEILFSGKDQWIEGRYSFFVIFESKF